METEIEIKNNQFSECNFIKQFLEKLTKLEFSHFIGFNKYEHVQPKDRVKNYRNGFLLKKVSTSYGIIEVLVPRDRLAEYDSNVVRKHKKRLLVDDNKIIYFQNKKEINLSLLSGVIRELTKITDQKALIDMTHQMKEFINSLNSQVKNADATY